MTPCEELEQALDTEAQACSDAKKDILLRAFLNAIGFGWLYDLLKGKDIDWKIFLDLLLALDVAAALAWLVDILPKVGLSGIGEEIVKKIGPWTLLFLIAMIILELMDAIDRWDRANKAYEEELKRVYHESLCDDKVNIFKRRGLSIP